MTFPLATKQKVIPPDGDPFYRDIAAEVGDVGRPQWNFHRYLAGRDGELAGLWDGRVQPDSDEIVDSIEEALGQS